MIAFETTFLLCLAVNPSASTAVDFCGLAECFCLRPPFPCDLHSSIIITVTSVVIFINTTRQQSSNFLIYTNKLVRLNGRHNKAVLPSVRRARPLVSHLSH